MAMKRQKNSFGAATDLQANVSVRRFKRRSRAAVVMGFVVARSAQIGVSTIPLYDFNFDLQLSTLMLNE